MIFILPALPSLAGRYLSRLIDLRAGISDVCGTFIDAVTPITRSSPPLSMLTLGLSRGGKARLLGQLDFLSNILTLARYPIIASISS